MTNFVEVIKACEAAEGSGSKKQIQAELLKADSTARELICLALDPYTVFGVKKFEMPTVGPRGTMGQVNYEEFFSILDKLANREITGDAARAAVTAAISLFPFSAQEYIARIFDKDLKAGFSAETANKVWNAPGGTGPQIPTFEVMLADKCESTEDFEKYITFPCQADWKYDGQRTICIVRDGQPVEYRARSGKPMDHLEGLYDEDLLSIRYHVGYDFVMDGESFASNFTETINAKKSGNDAAKAALRLRAFFMMPLTDWIAQSTKITMRQNRDELERRIFTANCKRIEISKGREVADFQDMTAYCNEVIDVHGQEGLILKDWNATYTWDRTFAWTKVKIFYDVDARIVGFYNGKAKSRLANTVGGVNCVAFLESGERVEFNVGSGFSDEQREDMKNNPQKWLDAVHVIKYQEVSRSKSKTVASLRFCTYEHSRDDKIVEV